MQLDSDYLDFLQNMESAVVRVYKSNPALRDPDVIKAYDRLIKFYQRKKKHLPEMDLAPSGAAGEVYGAVFLMCEWRRVKEPGETFEIEGIEGTGGNVPLPVVVRSLEKLLKSANRWHKKDGVRGYLHLTSNFIL